jgi:hypothetical protein
LKALVTDERLDDLRRKEKLIYRNPAGDVCSQFPSQLFRFGLTSPRVGEEK